MNNKRLGTMFEQEICLILAQNGWWVHFIAPDARGAQPFDIIAVKERRAIAIDCKTCVAKWFNISRLEDNQVMAFERWIACGNEDPMIAVKHNGQIIWIKYSKLKERRKVNLEGD